MQARRIRSSPSAPREVISRATIYILSGVLIGTGLGRETWQASSFMNVLAGFAGLIAYFTLEGLAARRASKTARRKRLKVQRAMARRIERHVRRRPAPLLGERHRSFGGQYLAVVARKR